MSLTVISEPLKSNAGVTDASALAVETQAIYELLRNDFGADVNDVTIGATGTIFHLTGDFTSEIFVGDRLFFDLSSPVLQGISTVFSVTFTNPDTEVELVEQLAGIIGSTTVNILNDLSSRSQYRVEFDFVNPIDSSQQLSGISYKPKQNGQLVADLGSVYVLIIERFDPIFNTVGNLRRSLDIKPIVREVWEGFIGSDLSLTAVLCIKGKLQMDSFVSGAKKGANYVDFLLYLNNTGKVFLTNFPERKVWFDLVASFDFIQDEDYPNRAGASTKLSLDRYDINKVFVENKEVQDLTFFSANFRNAGVNLVTADLAFHFIGVTPFDNAGTTQVGATLFFRILDEICINSIYIDWTNSLGGTDQYLFEFNQEVEELADVGVTVIPPITTDIGTNAGFEPQRAIQRYINNTSQRITCFADHVTNEELRALHEIKFSDVVFVHVDPSNAINSRVRVIIEDTYSTSYSTRSNLNLFTIKIRFPDNFDFFKALDIPTS